MYSSRVRPLKLVSRGRGYWSQGRGEKGERVSSAAQPGACHPGEAWSDCTHWATGVSRDQRPGRRKSSATWSPRCGLASVGIICGRASSVAGRQVGGSHLNTHRILWASAGCHSGPGWAHESLTSSQGMPLLLLLSHTLSCEDSEVTLFHAGEALAMGPGRFSCSHGS